MKKIHLITAMIFGVAAASSSQAGGDHDPQHGGVFVGGKAMDYELVAKPDTLQLYLRDHGKPMDISKFSAKVTLLNGTEKQEAELKPAGDKLEAKGTYKIGKGAKALAMVSAPGKSTASVRFVLK